MKLHTNIYILITFVLLISFLRSSKADSASLDVDLSPANPCDVVNCGKGTCREAVNSTFGFDCDCNTGWIKYQTAFEFGSVTFPPCVIPDCTIDPSCGTGIPSLQLPTPPFDLSDPCTFTWCGEIADGSCRSNGSDFRCYCSAASDNLLDMPTLPCVKKCALGGNCNPIVQASSSHGLKELRWGSKIEDSLKIMLILVALFHRWM